jgi:uncharacterized protein (DUF433 family)
VQLEDYFDFLSPLDIRVKGTRVGIETILGDYLKWGLSPEAIADRYRTVTLEQVYATLTYYWHDPERGDDYLRRVEEEIARQRREAELNPSPGMQRLRALARARDDAKRRVATAP